MPDSVEINFKTMEDSLSVDEIVEKIFGAFPDIHVTAHDFYADFGESARQMIADHYGNSGDEYADEMLSAINSEAESIGARKRFVLSVPGAGDLIGDITSERLYLVSETE